MWNWKNNLFDNQNDAIIIMGQINWALNCKGNSYQPNNLSRQHNDPLIRQYRPWILAKYSSEVLDLSL